MEDNDVRALKWVVGCVVVVLLVVILGGFISAYLHGQNSTPKIHGDVACVYAPTDKEESTAKEWRCSKVSSDS